MKLSCTCKDGFDGNLIIQGRVDPISVFGVFTADDAGWLDQYSPKRIPEQWQLGVLHVAGHFHEVQWLEIAPPENAHGIVNGLGSSRRRHRFRVIG
jgi:hypothetical protein